MGLKLKMQNAGFIMFNKQNRFVLLNDTKVMQGISGHFKVVEK